MKMFEENVKVRYSEMDYDLVLKPSALLQFLQDMASDNAENLGFGYSFVVKNNLAWFLLKYRIEFAEYPKGLYDLTFKTQPRGYNKLFAFRDFEIWSGEKRIGRAASTWALVNLDTKGMAPVSECLKDNPYMLPFEKQEDDLAYGKVKPPEKVDVEHEFEIRFDDLDVNKHVNNANYIVWAFEPLDFEFRKTHILKSLDMVFKKEIQYGHKVLTQIEIQGDKTIHIVKNKDTGEDLCMVSAEWVEK